MAIEATTIPRSIANNVIGPGPLVDNAIARVTGTTGLTLQGYTSGDPVASDTGIVTLPGNPAVIASRATNDLNVTGAGTAHTLIWNTEIVDQGGDWDGTSTFTCPVDGGGGYLVAPAFRLEGLAAAMTLIGVSLITSNRTYTKSLFNDGTLTSLTVDFAQVVDMEAGDTLTVTVTVSNGAGDTADVTGSSEQNKITLCKVF